MPSQLLATFRRFQLSFWIGFVIVGFLFSFSAILWLLGVASVSRARSVRTEFVDRDLRELVGRFDADERYVLEHNIDQLVLEIRDISPLLLPRQYYIGLPQSNLKVIPRQPPRNCFVDLIDESPSTSRQRINADKICFYFSQNEAVGRYLFFAADIYDDSIVPLKKGDTSLAADGLHITVSHNGKKVAWWLMLQLPMQINPGRMEINAFRENVDGTRERDKRVEGWAYLQRQADGGQVLHFMGRIEANQIPDVTSIDVPKNWPPPHWQEVRISVERKDVSAGHKKDQIISYRSKERSQLSIANLANSIFDSYSELTIKESAPFVRPRLKTIEPVTAPKNERHIFNGYLRMINGDLVIAEDKVTRSRILPDTNLSFIVTHPGIIIERIVWQSFLALLGIFIIGLIFVFYFYRNLLLPIFTLTRRIRYLVSAAPGDDHELPYSNQANELGTLARGFNELLAETRNRARHEAEEQTRREVSEERQRKELIHIREENLRLIGHEIRSPLQALISLHAPGEKSRPFLDRIHKALEYLQGTLSAQQAINERELDFKEVDIAQFLYLVAKQAPLARIKDVAYFGPDAGPQCRLDNESIEDCIENILKNADRFRCPNTLIRMTLICDEKYAIIKVENEGPTIASDDLERIFDYGMTTTPNQKNSGNGIGLYVARQYLLLMHSTVTALNTETGVCFEIKIPLSARRTSGSDVSFSTVGREERRMGLA